MLVFLASIYARYDIILLKNILLSSCPFESLSTSIKIKNRNTFGSVPIFYFGWEGGIRTPDDGTRTRCLTAWLLPRKCALYYVLCIMYEKYKSYQTKYSISDLKNKSTRLIGGFNALHIIYIIHHTRYFILNFQVSPNCNHGADCTKRYPGKKQQEENNEEMTKVKV